MLHWGVCTSTDPLIYTTGFGTRAEAEAWADGRPVDLVSYDWSTQEQFQDAQHLTQLLMGVFDDALAPVPDQDRFLSGAIPRGSQPGERFLKTVPLVEVFLQYPKPVEGQNYVMPTHPGPHEVWRNAQVVVQCRYPDVG